MIQPLKDLQPPPTEELKNAIDAFRDAAKSMSDEMNSKVFFEFIIVLKKN